MGDAKAAAADGAKKARKSVNKAVDKVVEATNIPLPDSPMWVSVLSGPPFL